MNGNALATAKPESFSTLDAVIVTHGHKGDETVLEGALRTPAKYIGMIGSRAKCQTILDHLRATAEKHHLTFAPDPATHDRCTLGGMIGNNSCGVHSIMAGKTVDNIESLDVLTYDGVRLTVGATADAAIDRALPPGEVDLVESASHQPIPPPPAERVLAPGTPVRLRRVEFPTGWLIAQRVVMTPRYHPWAYLEVGGDARPHVVVLSQTAASAEDLRGELDRLLTRDDPSSTFAGLPEEQRQAILRKEPLEGMGARALEMAWGLPEKKRIDRPAGTEEWVWPGGKRRAYLRDERLERFERR